MRIIVNRFRNVKISNISDSFEAQAGGVFSAYLVIDSLNIFLKTVLPDLFGGKGLTVILGAFFLFAFVHNKRVFSKTIKEIVLLELFFLIMVLCSLYRNSAVTASIIGRCIWLFAFAIPFFSMGRRVEDIRRFVDRTIISTWIVSFLCIGMTVFMIRNTGENYSMTMSYTMLYPVLLHIYKAKEEKVYIIPTVVELIFILTYGSRGAFLCVLVYFALVFLFDNALAVNGFLMRIGLVLIGICAIIIIFVNATTILGDLKEKGIYLRTIHLFLSGRGLSHDSGRGAIYEMVWGRILEKPILGWGIAGELSFMNSYSHNMFLDFLVEYGIPLGIILSVMVLGFLIVLFTRTIKNGRCVWIFFCSGFIPLMLSGTYLQQVFFWILMGLAFQKKSKGLYTWKKMKVQAAEY